MLYPWILLELHEQKFIDMNPYNVVISLSNKKKFSSKFQHKFYIDTSI